MSRLAANSRLSFGLFEIDPQTGELWKAGYRVKLQSQPFKVLAVLLDRPGEVITREELQLRLWGKDTVVDFDHSLGSAINKIREALGDSAENPVFVETLSKRGYRFIAPVSHLGVVESDGLLPHREPVQRELPSAQISYQGISAQHLPGPAVQPQVAARDQPTASPDQGTLLSAGQPSITSQTVPATASLVSLPEDSAAVISPAHVSTPSRRIRLPLAWLLAFAALVAALVGAYFVGRALAPVTPPEITQITRNGNMAPGSSHMEDLAAGVTDGTHLFASTIDLGHSGLVAISLPGGAITPLSVPDELAAPALGDLSPDGANLLLRSHLSRDSEQPLWVVPSTGGSALRVGDVLAHDATWMPDGEDILYAAGNGLYLTSLTVNTPRSYASLPGRAFWLRWQPGGKLLRFTIIDPITHSLSLWQISPGDRTPRRVLPGWTNPSSECCGVWTADGAYFVFQSMQDRSTDLWRLSGSSLTNPVRLTNGPLRYEAPVAAREGDRIFFLGVDSRSEMKRFSPESKTLAPETGFLSTAIRVDFSRDGKWVAWTDDDGLLWRARSDGSEKLQLTPGSINVFLARWSPDGSELALMGREQGKAWQIYVVEAAGGAAQRLLTESRNEADPSWSPDGHSIVFGRINDMMGKESAARTLQVYDLRTHQTQPVPDSEGLFSPRWSPDGKYIAALSLDQRQVRLFSLESRTWKALPVNSGADPFWSSDSRAIYVHLSQDPAQPIDRISVPEGKVEQIIELADHSQEGVVDFVFGGLTPDNRPLVLERVFTGNFYSLNLKDR